MLVHQEFQSATGTLCSEFLLLVISLEAAHICAMQISKVEFRSLPAITLVSRLAKSQMGR